MSDLLKQRLQARLGYEFRDPAQLDLALTHRSHGARNNERLEFLGDSILNFIIGEALYQQFPEAREGQLSRLRSQMVKGETLAMLAREFELGECLRLGEGEMKSGGHRRESILADTVEALIGAIYLESGFQVCAERVNAWYQSRLQALSLAQPAKDAKTRLQEFLQAHKLPLPEYDVVEVEGEAHAHQFTIECRVTPIKETVRAQASSRRVAEKQAAAEMLEKLQKITLKPKRKG
ncbi:ribonuclease III [Marinimicrobium sp. UBA4509]|uniref:ribonuclease III n=1 Tax=Marinimicrobium TaxID=359337 RepID=UPI00257A7DD9|nr:ribonuclease III [Marinimicrobium sp. UBA4509]